MTDINTTLIAMAIATPLAFTIFKLIFLAIVAALVTSIKDEMGKYSDLITKTLGTGFIALIVIYLRNIIIRPIKQLIKINKE